MMKDKDLDRVFKEKFEAFKPKAPEGMWANIEAGLSESKPKTKKRTLYSWISVAAAVVLVFMGLWWGRNPEQGIKHSDKYVSALISDKPMQGKSKVQTPDSDHQKPEDIQASSSDLSSQVKKTTAPVAKTDNTPIEESNIKDRNMVNDQMLAQTMHVASYGDLPLKTLPDYKKTAVPVVKPEPGNLVMSYQVAYKEFRDRKMELQKVTDALDVSTILNTVVKGIQSEGVSAPVFSEDKEGILKVDFSRLLSKR